jgi:6-methylsalicylate decarboxylase
MNRLTRDLTVDVHQHLWTPPLIDALRARSEPPRLRGWVLELPDQAPLHVPAADHDVGERLEALASDGVDLAVVSLSSALGLERLPPREAQALLDAYHHGASELGPSFRAWASACLTRVDARALERALELGFVGLELPADALLDADDYDRVAPLLGVLESAGRPLFIHPGPATAPRGAPAWWAPVVGYPQQMHAAWLAFGLHGRPRHRELRVCFALLAGLAPLHAERSRARGGPTSPHDPHVFVEISSYGPRAIDATVRALGVDALVNGSDRPYAEPAAAGLGPAAEVAIRTTNPIRLLDLEEVSVELSLASSV